MGASIDEKTYSGTIKSLNRGSGFGFISCDETYAIFHRDIFLHINDMVDFNAGDIVQFNIDMVGGNPQARNVRPLRRKPGNTEDPLGVRYKGTIKSMNMEKGFGFISCPETNCDVFLHKNQLGLICKECVFLSALK